MTTGRSAKLYQERRQLRETLRGPATSFCPEMNAVHSVELEPPLPDPAIIVANTGTPPPDVGGVTKPWPHGDKEQPV